MVVQSDPVSDGGITKILGLNNLVPNTRSIEHHPKALNPESTIKPIQVLDVPTSTRVGSVDNIPLDHLS